MLGWFNGVHMTITLEIPEELKNELTDEANQLGISLPEYTVRVLYARPIMKAPPKTGKELVAYWKNAGVIGTRTDIVDSQQHARMLRAEAERRTRDNNN
jgi:hypothetical protein